MSITRTKVSYITFYGTSLRKPKQLKPKRHKIEKAALNGAAFFNGNSIYLSHLQHVTDEATVESPDDQGPKGIKAYPVEKTEAKESSTDFTLADSVALLKERKYADERFIYRSPGGLAIMHLRYISKGSYDMPFELLFKRCPELNPYFPKIETWLKLEKREWGNVIIADDTYMGVRLNSSKSDVIDCINRIQTGVFGFDNLNITTPDLSLSKAAYGRRHPTVGALAILVSIVSVAGLSLYNFNNLYAFGKPKLQHVDRPELYLISLIVIGLLTFRYCHNDPRKKRNGSWTQISIWRLVLVILLLLPFFTS